MRAIRKAIGSNPADGECGSMVGIDAVEKGDRAIIAKWSEHDSLTIELEMHKCDK